MCPVLYSVKRDRCASERVHTLAAVYMYDFVPRHSCVVGLCT